MTSTANITQTTAAQRPIELKRTLKQYRVRHVAVWNVTSGELCSESGPGMQLAPHAPLSAVLALIERLPAHLRPRTLYLIGGDRAETTPPRSWWLEPAQLTDQPWRYDGYEIAAHAASSGQQEATENAGSYTRESADAGLCLIDVRMSALWFPGVMSPRIWRDCWNTLRAALQRHFDPSATLLATPAMTGLDLLHRSLPANVRYPLAPQELQELLRRISGQGRFEFCPDPLLLEPGQQISGLWWLDARWMYAACVRGLPTGTPIHHDYGAVGEDPTVAYLPYATAWYRISFQIPRDWSHRGLIGVRSDADETRWPAEPGRWYHDVWTTGAELALALEQGWSVLIFERWAYEPGRSGSLPDPTRAWIVTLRELRQKYADNAPIAAAIRHLVIDTVGMWHRSAGEKLRITPLRDYPGGAARLHHLDRAAGLAYWYERTQLPREAQAWQRPEWSTAVWSRARARLNTAARRVPREGLVAYRADALVTCYEPLATLWLDDDKPGTFRLKGHVSGPLAMPATIGELLELRRQAEHKESEAQR